MVIDSAANGWGKLTELVGGASAGSGRTTFTDLGCLILSKDFGFKVVALPGQSRAHSPWLFRNV